MRCASSCRWMLVVLLVAACDEGGGPPPHHNQLGFEPADLSSGLSARPQIDVIVVLTQEPDREVPDAFFEATWTFESLSSGRAVGVEARQAETSAHDAPGWRRYALSPVADLELGWHSLRGELPADDLDWRFARDVLEDAGRVQVQYRVGPGAIVTDVTVCDPILERSWPTSVQVTLSEPVAAPGVADALVVEDRAGHRCAEELPEPVAEVRLFCPDLEVADALTLRIDPAVPLGAPPGATDPVRALWIDTSAHDAAGRPMPSCSPGVLP